jgi:hypothetical protein
LNPAVQAMSVQRITIGFIQFACNPSFIGDLYEQLPDHFLAHCFVPALRIGIEILHMYCKSSPEIFELMFVD